MVNLNMSRIVFIFWCCISFSLQAQKPSFKNGLENFVAKNTIYPIFALDNCIQGTVEIAFKIDKEGNITYATVAKSVGADLDAEALRLISLTSGKWQVPAGYDTKFLIRSPMKFSLKGYGCEQINEAAIAIALKRYRDQKIATDQIIIYYKNIKAGIKNEMSEAEVLALKNELEFDDDFLAKKIAIAERKIKQGDLQSACGDFKFVKFMGSAKVDVLIAKYCK